jgi:hypothetical protein
VRVFLILSINAVEISLGTNEEICLKRRNATCEKCALNPDFMEIKSLLSTMKNDITKLNDEIILINEKLNKTEICDNSVKRRGKGKLNYVIINSKRTQLKILL